jgi:hypothetical protein
MVDGCARHCSAGSLRSCVWRIHREQLENDIFDAHCIRLGPGGGAAALSDVKGNWRPRSGSTGSKHLKNFLLDVDDVFDHSFFFFATFLRSGIRINQCCRNVSNKKTEKQTQKTSARPRQHGAVPI